jgi:hypothetical protein
MSSEQDAAHQAEVHAAQAAQAAANLKVGTWESVQALATLSIAESLIARSSE